ncbi:MAG: hypothetical protein AAF715_24370 [Myxococcota bacterium]
MAMPADAEGLKAAIFGGGPGPVKTRKPVVALLFPFGLIFAVAVLTAILGFISPYLILIGNLLFLGVALLVVVQLYKMVKELLDFTGSGNFAAWHMFIPIYQYLILWLKVPEEVRLAKQRAGVNPPESKGIVLYVFLFVYALASDLNEIAAGLGGGGGGMPAMAGGAPAPMMGAAPGAAPPMGGPPPGGGFGGPPPGGAPPPGGGFGGPPPGGGGFGGPPPGGAPPPGGGYGGPPPGGGYG